MYPWINNWQADEGDLRRYPATEHWLSDVLQTEAADRAHNCWYCDQREFEDVDKTLPLHTDSCRLQDRYTRVVPMAVYEKLPAEMTDNAEDSSSNDDQDIVRSTAPTKGVEVGSMLRAALKNENEASSSSGQGGDNPE